MRKPTMIFAGLTVAGALALAGCSTTADTSTGTSDTTTTTTETTSTTLSATDVTERTYEQLGVKDVEIPFDEASAIDITLSDSGSTGGDGVTVDGSTVTITEGGTYRLTGTLSAGQVIVDTDDEDVNIILDGVSITSDDTAALDIENADEVVVWLAEGSTNSLADAADATASTDDSETDVPNATLYSTADLWIAGTGSLDVTAVANDGIASKDGLVIEDGTITVTAADDGIRGKDYLVIEGGDITVDADGDGLKVTNEDVVDDNGDAVGVLWMSGGTVDITSGSDGIDVVYQATIAGGELTIAAGDDGIHSDGILAISDGTVDVTTSYEGLEGMQILLSGGTGTIVSSDDGFNATDGSGSSGTEMGGGQMPGGGTRPGRDSSSTDTSSTSSTTTGDSTAVTTAAYTTTSTTTDGATDATTVAGGMGETASEGVYLEISGGTWVIDAEGDGLDSNGTAVMTGGTVVVNGPASSGNGALDVNGSFTVSGGTLAASGSSGMLVAPTSDGQGVLTIAFSSQVAAGTVLTVTDTDGNVIASFTSEKTAQSLVLSSPEIVSGETYTVTADATVTGTSVGGLVVDGTATGGTELGDLTAD
ncbi:carbohydrate-binding domain-containing protein [Demequina lignilytica]|uniref:Carbohydrate-binding domain-containing protein n=1 Tax=Demequina lignilytica TaxID=3051663 RepID=A0AAW7M3U3_9MICO|nr:MULTISPECIES: carbohydrate-binding domain-containing protein [unclassified Demequina]MDN4477961.1 carbohydrate-binding domain-containing protein [Demequina sp. SYSU T00039-1]MDN4484260.1 carbohydrate-binding domain-containing protein [Demequina sp. SYSU T0a273]MDN4487870.1 carbohydrate-binding domain-containing protein [Demequina sp. SYSU T00039]MDN4490747.1 carbohydrate-binding domain-containing protein [Demequina sp. SYSU T00068]